MHNIISDAEKERFSEITAMITETAVERTTIGLLSEKTLHAVVKAFCDGDEAHQEQKLCGYVADIFDGERITEIQTKHFYVLKNKLRIFTEKYPVTVVYPLIRTRVIHKVNTVTGEVGPARKSPKKGTLHTFFEELYGLSELICDPNIKFRVYVVDVEEYRFVKSEKDRGEKGDLIPTGLAEGYCFDCADDFAEVIPGELPEEFTAAQYSKAAHINRATVSRELNVLKRLGCVAESGKTGREKLWRRI